MYSFTTVALATQFLVLGTYAQNSTNSTRSCSDLDLEDAIKYNTSTSRTMPALFLDGARPLSSDTARFSIQTDDSRTWNLSVRTQSMAIDQARGMPDDAHYEQTLFLDTGDSDTTDIGVCLLNLAPEAKSWGFRWTKEFVERSLEDNGDCTNILGNECVQALKNQAAEEAAEWPLRTGSCFRMNHTMPAECTPDLHPEPTSLRQMNLTHLDGSGNGHLNSEFDPSLECNDLNLSSTHSAVIAPSMSYNAAVRFPTINIVTFWPNRTSGLQSYLGSWVEDVHVELHCMRPDSHISEWSEEPPSAREILDAEGTEFREPSAASTLRYGMLGWMSALVMGIMVLM